MGIIIKKAKRISELPPYLFAEIDRRKREALARGVDLIDLGIGDPDIPASYVKEAAQLKKGEISASFRDESGNYHIVKLDERKDAHTPSMQADRPMLEAMAKQDKVIKEFDRLFRELRNETYIDIRLQ